MSTAAIESIRARPGFSAWRLGSILAVAALVTGVLAGELTVSGHGAAIFALGVVALVVVLWQKPRLIPIVVVSPRSRSSNSR